ncbi:hypothetical protein A3216_10110 [Mycobacterium leprae 7935681]|nr:hypothetical protein A3216_10110 [Mycobacterium leprae 7935681]
MRRCSIGGIAIVNGSDAVVISVLQVAVGALLDRLVGQGRWVHRLVVSHVFHAVLMETMVKEFSRMLDQVSMAESRIGLVSNMTGKLPRDGY